MFFTSNNGGIIANYGGFEVVQNFFAVVALKGACFFKSIGVEIMANDGLEVEL